MADDVSPPKLETEHEPGATGSHDSPVVQAEPVVAVQAAPEPPPVAEPVLEAPAAVQLVETAPDAPAAVSVAEPEPIAPPPQPEAMPEPAPAAPSAPTPRKDPVTKKAVAPREEEEEPPAPTPSPEPEKKKHWYVVKVQSGREDTIKEAIEKRVRKEGLEEFFGQFEGGLAIVIPVEKITEIKQDKNGRRVTRTKERKLYPGYLMVEVEYNDRILYLFRETSGVGDFVGAHPSNLERAPTPMSEKEIQRMLGPKDKEKEAPVPVPPKNMGVGDRVRVVDGTFNGMEGTVKQILDAVGKVQVEVSIFGRPVAVELEYYQVEEA